MATTPTPFDNFPPEMQRLIALVENNLHYITRVEMTREQAIRLRQMISIPLGGLVQRHNLPPSTMTLRHDRERMRKKRLDTGSD